MAIGTFVIASSILLVIRGCLYLHGESEEACCLLGWLFGFTPFRTLPRGNFRIEPLPSFFLRFFAGFALPFSEMPSAASTSPG